MTLKLYKKRKYDRGVCFETKRSARIVFPPEADKTKQTTLKEIKNGII